MNLSNYGFMLIVLGLLCFTLLTVIDRVIVFPSPSQTVAVPSAKVAQSEPVVVPAPLPAPVMTWTRPRNGLIPPPPPVPVF